MLEGRADPFRRRRTTTLSEYSGLFEDAPPESTIGECSPEYLRAPGSATRIADSIPECRVLLTLRNPVDRLISDWKMCRRDGVESLDLVPAIEAIERRQEQREFGGHYLVTSSYSSGLAEFFAAFERSQTLVLIQERWTKDLATTATAVGQFLDVDPAQFENILPADNRSGVPTSQMAKQVWAARRRAAPFLADRIPARMKQAIDGGLQRTLDSAVEPAERDYVERLVLPEKLAVLELLGSEVPEWS